MPVVVKFHSPGSGERMGIDSKTVEGDGVNVQSGLVVVTNAGLPTLAVPLDKLVSAEFTKK
jgi:hypothetical protein